MPPVIEGGAAGEITLGIVVALGGDDVGRAGVAGVAVEDAVEEAALVVGVGAGQVGGLGAAGGRGADAGDLPASS